jgi:hypothetical protein
MGRLAVVGCGWRLCWHRLSAPTPRHSRRPPPPGFLYPAKQMSKATYGEGDTIRCELDFDARLVSFSVNGRAAGTAPWRGGTDAYPAISVSPGDLVCEVAFE